MAAVSALGFGLVVLLVVETALRIGYPCDLMMWSESPFMTNMLKLVNGVPIYTDPVQVNSYVYSPGLEYLTYAILQPLGLALDVRFCRFVNVVVGIAAALCAGTLITRVEADLRGGRRDRRVFLVASCTAALVVFNTITSDGLHPDNLHMLHAAGSLLLCYEALRRGSLPLAAATIAVAGLGVTAKQPAALAPVGAVAALLLGRRWGRGAVLTMAAVLAGVGLFLGWFVLADANRRFFILDVLTGQPFLYVTGIAVLDNFLRGHRLILLLIAPFSILVTLRAGGPAGRRFLLAWAALGITEAAPSTLPSLKVYGIDNNFAVMALWLWLVNGPALVHLLTRAPQPDRTPVALLATCLWVGVLLSLLPMKLPPGPDVHRYCDDVVKAVGADLAAGRRVFLSHGTTPFIRNGARPVLLDRAASAVELWTANKLSVLEGMKRRLADGYYDRLYFVGEWTVAKLEVPMERYVKVGQIRPPATPRLGPFIFPYWAGIRFVIGMHPLTIYEPRSPERRAAPAPGNRP